MFSCQSQRQHLEREQEASIQCVHKRGDRKQKSYKEKKNKEAKKVNKSEQKIVLKITSSAVVQVIENKVN